MTGNDPERQSGPWTRAEWLLAAALFAGTFLSRIPFRTTLLYAWDSVLYTRALDDFDVSLDQPHQPGHIYYVGLVKLVNFFLGDPNASLVWVSVFFAAAAAAALFWVGRMMLGRPIGLLAALLLATSLSFWAYSGIAYPYTLLAFLSIVVAGLIYRTWEGRVSYVLPAALALALASGFRQDLLPFMLPLLLVGLAGKPVRYLAGAGAVMIAGVAAWYVPSALLSGGFAAYSSASSAQSDYIIATASVFGRGLEGLWANFYSFSRFLVLALTAAAPFLAYFILRLLLPRARWLRRDRRLLFLAVWALPSILFYIFIHIGEYGYVFSFLPAALLASAWGAAILAGVIGGHFAGGRRTRGVFNGLAAAIIAANLLFFLIPGLPLSAGRLAARDDILRTRLDAVGENFDPETTLIITVFDYQQVSYYLPEYRSWNFDPAVDSDPVTDIPAGVEKIVIFEEYVRPRQSGAWEELPLERGQALYFTGAGDARLITVDWDRQEVSLEGI